MNERIRNILVLLIKNPEIKMAELTNELGLTRRQINYSINQFNEELAHKEIPQIIRNHTGDFQIPLEVVRIIANDTNCHSSELLVIETVFSESERAALLLAFLITNLDYVSLDHLTDFLGVSKNTILEDFKRIEWLVQKYNLSVDYNRQQGYQLKGNEHKILQVLSDLVKQHKFFRNESLKEQLVSLVSEKETIHLIHGMEQMLHVSYSDESIDYLQSAVRFVLQRALKNSSKVSGFFKGNVQMTPEYKFLNVLIQDRPWSINQDYLEWIALLFLTSNVFERKTTQEYDSDAELKRLIQKMVDNFQKQTLIVIENRENFERRILSHLRPACFRIKHSLSLGIYSLDSLIKDSNHGILNELMKELVVPTENWLGKAFPNDELELLSYYFGFQLTSASNGDSQKPRAVVVCENGIIVSKLMRENLKKLFPEIHFLSSLSVREFYTFASDYDLVFTTTALKSEIIQFIVDPIMTYKEQIRLRYRVLKELGINDIGTSADELLALIRKYTTIHKVKDLRDELEYFLLREKQDSPLENFKTLPPLTNYLKPDYITITDKEYTWKQALEIACKPLLDNQIINQEFSEDCKKQIETDSYTGYFGLKTSIPHTTIEHGVLRDGVSLLISKKPIIFPNGNKVHFIYPLSFYDLTRHLRAVNQIADISNNDLLLTELLQEKDVKRVYQIIRQNT